MTKVRIGTDVKVTLTLKELTDFDSTAIKQLRCYFIRTTELQYVDLANPGYPQYYCPTEYDCCLSGWPKFNYLPYNGVVFNTGMFGLFNDYHYFPTYNGFGCRSKQFKLYQKEYLAASRVLEGKNQIQCYFPAIDQKELGTYKLVIVVTVFQPGWGSNNLRTFTIDEGDIVDFVDDEKGESGDINLVDDSENEVIPEGLTKFEYAINGKTKQFAVEKYCDISFDGQVGIVYPQGCCVYGKYLFNFYHSGKVVTVMDMETKRKIRTISLPQNWEWHYNNVNFGTTIAPGSKFPYLYASIQHLDVHAIFVYKVGDIDSSDQDILTKVQTITLPAPEVVEQYYPDCAIDEPNGFIYASGFTENHYKANESLTNMVVITKYRLPAVSEGDVAVDKLDQFFFEMASYSQGTIIHNGKLYCTYGLGDAHYPDKLYIIDLKTKKKLTTVPLSAALTNKEIQSIFRYNNKFYVNITENNSSVSECYRLYGVS